MRICDIFSTLLHRFRSVIHFGHPTHYNMKFIFVIAIVGFFMALASAAPSSNPYNSYYNYWQRINRPTSEALLQQDENTDPEADSKIEAFARLMNYWQRFTTPNVGKVGEALFQQEGVDPEEDGKLKELAGVVTSYYYFWRQLSGPRVLSQQNDGVDSEPDRELAQVMTSYYNYLRRFTNPSVLHQQEESSDLEDDSSRRERK